MTEKNDTNKDVAIKEVTIQLGKKELSMSIQDAKKLREVLNELFGTVVVEKRVVEEHHHHDYWPYYWHYNTTPQWTLGSGNNYQLVNGGVFCSAGDSTNANQGVLKMEVK